MIPKMALEYDEIIAIVIGQIVGIITFTMFYDKLLKGVRNDLKTHLRAIQFSGITICDALISKLKFLN